jgi:hypothetical protein
MAVGSMARHLDPEEKTLVDHLHSIIAIVYVGRQEMDS